jgi:hypothetical protein
LTEITSNNRADNRPPRTNYLRRGVGVLICFSPIGLALGSLVYGLICENRSTSGLWLALAGLALGLLNMHLSFGRPMLYQWRHGSIQGYRHESGLPGIGTLGLVLAVSVGFGSVYTALVALAGLLVDTGGLPWFLIATWRDRSLWDGQR